MVFVLYSGKKQLLVELDSKLTRLPCVTSLCLAKFVKHNKSNTAFLHKIIIIFSPFYLSEATYVISSFNMRTELQKLIPEAMIIL